MNKLHAGVAAAVLGTGLAVAGAGTAHAAYPGVDGTIAVVNAGDIYTLDPTEQLPATTRLTSTGNSAGPRWSPDGAQIAYDRGGQLWVMKANGSGQRRVSGLTGTGQPAWSPDGRYLAVTVEGAHPGLYRVTVSSGATALFRAGGGDSPPTVVDPFPGSSVAWSPDGRKLAVQTYDCEGSGNYDVCLDTLKLPSATALVGREHIDHAYGGSNHPRQGRAYHADYKPDSSAYQFTEVRCPVIDGPCTPPPTPRLVLPGGVKIPDAHDGVYSPSGTQIAYVQDDVDPNVVVAGADGSSPRYVAAGSQPDWRPTH